MKKSIKHVIIQEIPRKEKHFHGDRLKRSNGFYQSVTDPRRELAESLPLCHPNDDYLKDFNPVAGMTRIFNFHNRFIPIYLFSNYLDVQIEENETNPEDGRNPNSSIKVIHFGVV